MESSVGVGGGSTLGWMSDLSLVNDRISSMTEVQRIIGVSLSKIQIGRHQRGGLPLHKNLLVATVLNKARELYMQETMYMNYKMMTAGFSGVTDHPYSPLHIIANSSSTSSSTSKHDEEKDVDDIMESPPESTDYEEDSESDVEDDVDLASPVASESLNSNNRLVVNTLAHRHCNGGGSGNDEGFIEDNDCDCNVRNFGPSDSRVPFQYCYNCAPFHSSNGRGPTLVPVSLPPNPTAANSDENSQEEEAIRYSTSTIYDMDSKSRRQEICCLLPSPKLSSSVGESTRDARNSSTKKRRLSSESGTDAKFVCSVKRRRRFCSNRDTDHQSNTSIGQDGDEKSFNPAFRDHEDSTTVSGGIEPQMEIEQLTSLVSIFSFGQKFMAAVAANECCTLEANTPTPHVETEEGDSSSDGESDTSSDSGNSSDSNISLCCDDSTVACRLQNQDNIFQSSVQAIVAS